MSAESALSHLHYCEVHITDWTVICTANWSWHPHQPAPVVKKNKPQSTFYKDARFTKLQEKMCGLSALPWRPNSTATNRSWRRRHHSSPERPWSCRLWTPRRRLWGSHSGYWITCLLRARMNCYTSTTTYWSQNCPSKPSKAFSCKALNDLPSKDIIYREQHTLLKHAFRLTFTM